jgi:hypothetical protein
MFGILQRQHEPGDDWNFDNDAARHIFPVHWLNSASLVVAHAGFLMWIFYSPHMSFVEAAKLDVTCGSFFMLNLLGNLFNTGASMRVCSGDETAREILLLLCLSAMFGMSIFGCNILSHRYLIEKAKTIIKL